MNNEIFTHRLIKLIIAWVAASMIGYIIEAIKSESHTELSQHAIHWLYWLVGTILFQIGNYYYNKILNHE
jgi:Na+-driven multidrug efflux pump